MNGSGQSAGWSRQSAKVLVHLKTWGTTLSMTPAEGACAVYPSGNSKTGDPSVGKLRLDSAIALKALMMKNDLAVTVWLTSRVTARGVFAGTSVVRMISPRNSSIEKKSSPANGC